MKISFSPRMKVSAILWFLAYLIFIFSILKMTELVNYWSALAVTIGAPAFLLMWGSTVGFHFSMYWNIRSDFSTREWTEALLMTFGMSLCASIYYLMFFLLLERAYSNTVSLEQLGDVIFVPLLVTLVTSWILSHTFYGHSWFSIRPA